MKKLVSFGLRWSCLVVIASCAAYLVARSVYRTDWYKERLYQQLVKGTAKEQMDAAVGLAYLRAEDYLLRALREQVPSARDLAQRALEHVWFTAAGDEAFQIAQIAHRATENDDLEEALNILNDLVQRYPKFAEGWNRRASVYWLMGEPKKSLADCERALLLNPRHYGAWQGLGICELELGHIVEACQALRRALKIVPYDHSTRNSLRRCEELLRTFPNPDKTSVVTLVI